MSDNDENYKGSVMFTPSGVSFFKVRQPGEEDDDKKPSFFKRIYNKVCGWFKHKDKKQEDALINALPPELREIGRKVLKEHPGLGQPTQRRVELHGALDVIGFLLEQADMKGDRENDRIVVRLSEDEDSDVKIRVILKERGPEVVASVVPVREETGTIHFNKERMSAISECLMRLTDCFPYISPRVDFEHCRIVGDVPFFVAGLSGIIKTGSIQLAAHYVLSRIFISALAITSITKALLRVDEGEDAEVVFLQEMPRMRKHLREETEAMQFLAFEPKEEE